MDISYNDSLGINRESSSHITHLHNYFQKGGLRGQHATLSPQVSLKLSSSFSHVTLKEKIKFAKRNRLFYFQEPLLSFSLYFFFPKKSRSLNMIWAFRYNTINWPSFVRQIILCDSLVFIFIYHYSSSDFFEVSWQYFWV